MINKKTIELDNKEHQLFYSCKRGSSIYGTFIEGVSDIDTLEVFVADTKTILGLKPTNDDYTSNKGDNSIYEIGKYFKLLYECNPNTIETLFVDRVHITYSSEMFEELYSMRNDFVTNKLLEHIRGYALSQFKGCLSYDMNNFNYKMCGHAIRLAHTYEKTIDTGVYTIKLDDDICELVKNIRLKNVSDKEISNLLRDYIQKLDKMKSMNFPNQPNIDKLNDLLVRIRLSNL